VAGREFVAGHQIDCLIATAGIAVNDRDHNTSRMLNKYISWTEKYITPRNARYLFLDDPHKSSFVLRSELYDKNNNMIMKIYGVSWLHISRVQIKENSKVRIWMRQIFIN
jgi:hypothetical protein